MAIISYTYPNWIDRLKKSKKKTTENSIMFGEYVLFDQEPGLGNIIPIPPDTDRKYQNNVHKYRILE